jgi:hypothetical protein
MKTPKWIVLPSWRGTIPGFADCLAMPIICRSALHLKRPPHFGLRLPGWGRFFAVARVSRRAN